MDNMSEKNKKEKETPLTLQELADYSQEILFPAMEERFATKSDLNDLRGDMNGLKGKLNTLKVEFKGFRDETLSGHDQILKKLDILLTEKEVGEYQKTKERKMWLIMIGAMKRSSILTPKELQIITQLEIF